MLDQITFVAKESNKTKEYVLLYNGKSITKEYSILNKAKMTKEMILEALLDEKSMYETETMETLIEKLGNEEEAKLHLVDLEKASQLIDEIFDELELDEIAIEINYGLN